MKPMSMLLGGILVSSIALMAVAQQNKPHFNAHPGHLPAPAATQPQRNNAQRAQPFQPPVPRGNLRGDIASNARSLPEPSRNDPEPRGR
jgi:hypothetical protein